MKRKRKQENMGRDRDNAMASFRPLSQYRSYMPTVGDSYIDGFKDATGWSEDEIMDYTNPARDVVDWDDYDEGFEDGLSALETVGEPLPEKRKRNGSTRKQDNLIEIPEEVRIPGTDVILEKGDKITVGGTSQSRKLREASVVHVRTPYDYLFLRNTPTLTDWGKLFIANPDNELGLREGPKELADICEEIGIMIEDGEIDTPEFRMFQSRYKGFPSVGFSDARSNTTLTQVVTEEEQEAYRSL